MFKNEDGAVLVLSIIVILVLTVLATALVGSINNNISFTKRHEDDVKTFYAAEAGIEKGINQIINDRDTVDDAINSADGKYVLNSDSDDYWLDDSSYKIEILDFDEDDFDEYDYKIISNSTNNNSSSELIIKVNISEKIPASFNNALTTNGDLNIDQSDVDNDSDSPIINGNIYANKLGVQNDLSEEDKFSFNKGEINGDIFANEIGIFENSGAQITSNIYAGEISTKHGQKFSLSGGTIDGDIYTNQFGYFDINPVNIPSFFNGEIHAGTVENNSIDFQPLDNTIDDLDNIIPDFSEYFNNENNVYLGDENNPDYDGKVVELTGNNEYNNFNNDGSGIIIVNGDLSIKNNIKANKDNEDNYLIILVDGDIETNMHIESNVFIYATGTITISNNPGGNSNGRGNPGKFDMNGSIMANEGIIIEDIRNKGLKLNHNNKFLEVFEKVGYGIPQLGNNNQGSNNGESENSIEIVSWQEN